MKLEKGINSYLTIDEGLDLLELEKIEQAEIFKTLDIKVQEYSLIKATTKIEALNIYRRKGAEGLTFPLPYQKIVPFEIELCCVLEALYLAINQVTPELEDFRKGIISQSEKTASVTYEPSLISKYKNISFLNLEAYKLIEPYISKAYKIR